MSRFAASAIQQSYVVALVFALAAALFAFIANDGAANPSVQEYYSSLESRLGYWLLLGNTRHCGLYPKRQISPFSISKAQRVMEDHVFDRLGLAPGSRVLDAGAGSGYVAIHMAQKGLNVQAIDITPIHLEDARMNVDKRGLQDKVDVRFGDYHDLSDSSDASFDGIYTMETFVHADEPIKVLRNFYRLLRPGGVLVLNEADFNRNSELLQDVLRLSHCQNTLAQGALAEMLKEVGFTDVDVEDLTDEVLPLWRLFGVIGYVPYRVLKFFGLHTRFTNLMAGVETYLHWGEGRYISVRAVKLK
ncbi:S-adenosyl-L-methionine-dependent Diels-Alderase iccD [Exophiala dermatitidis]